MALPTTNIGLNAIHVEVGGTTGTQCSLNESDIRGIGAPDTTYAGADGISTTASSMISIGEFRNAVDAVAMSTTNYARINSGNDTTFIDRSITSGIVFNTIYMDMRLRRQDNYVYYEVKNTSSSNTSQWWNAAGTSQGSMGTSYITMGRFNLAGITAIKMNWSKTSSPSGSSGTIAGNTTQASATYAAVDDTFQTVSNGQSIGARMTASAAAECYAQMTATCVVTMDVIAQKSGYLDTTLGTYRHECRAVAISNNCF